MKKNNKGITLIALIVTIIVLLILAGITVASLNGDNGLIDKTSEAQFRTEIAQYQEDLDLSIIKEEGKNKRGRTNKFNATSYDDIKKIIPSFHKKYENSLVIEEDKLVFKGNNRDLYKLSYEMGLISSDDLLDDEILEELQPFITEWTVEAGDTITLPISGTCDFTVNYGDGTEELKVTSSTDEDRIHTYTNAGRYTVTIKGKCEIINFYFNSDTVTREKITKILQWGNINVKEINFGNCKKLSGPIPDPSKNSFANTASVGRLFQNCSNLDCNIPKKILYNCNKLKTANCVFEGTKISGEIPERIFKDCENVVNLASCFYGCNNISGNIPQGLFENCSNVTNLSWFFQGCTGITGPIPEELFNKCSKVTNMAGIFRYCSGITGDIPEKLFINCNKVTNFSNVFRFCPNISGVIPEKLFSNCTEISDISAAFEGTKVSNIPANLFLNCNKITNFQSTFYDCSYLTGNAPDLWSRNNVTSSKYCFHGCRNLSNYNQIPSSWGGGGE